MRTDDLRSPAASYAISKLAERAIAALFPGYANTNGAVGYFVLDTTTLTNGVHTIAWVVRDSAGNASGIGSRYFTVVNP